jgi:hypothetical protein
LNIKNFSLSGVSVRAQHWMFIHYHHRQLPFFNCSFSATLNLTFVPTRIVMRSLDVGLKPSTPPSNIVLHASLVFFFEQKKLVCLAGVSVGAQHRMFFIVRPATPDALP